MSQPALNDNIVTWTFQNYAAIVGLLSGLAICALVLYIYSRSGSLIFLRDLLWRFFGGSTAFENEKYEATRKNLREVEYYRFEFNIPAQNLEQAQQADQWITANRFSYSDVARIRKYIDWSDFANVSLKEKMLTPFKKNGCLGLGIFFLVIISITPPLAGSSYLMVSLKKAPDVPAFYLSENNAKFHIWPSETLSVDDCKSPTVLEKFYNDDFSEDTINTLCSLFLSPTYREDVKRALTEQKGFLLFIACFSIVAVFCLLTKLSRLGVAKKLHDQINTQSSNAATEALQR
ncbi:hypothetical protein SAMN04490179_5212 [Pseudomonas antarctica]|uniref:Uncharacterized protein n=1 Tax=Pseudomonas antarctica TaxID=219572 RepID=A0A1H0D2U4_9PSED|nr:DUF6216 family protein [Pseudomonas antarctica]KAF2406301.1 hypothetical protein PSAN_55260 [Pseudomonas antarctica]SDN64376.1 hypothetical protein SAMN04490179_5212 [Pseudomonas antarctica]